MMMLAIISHHSSSKSTMPSNVFLSLPKNATAHQKEHIKIKAKQVNWHKLTVRRGDTLAGIFSRLKIKQSDLLLVLKSDKRIVMLHPGQTIYIKIDNKHDLQALKYSLNTVKTLELTRQNDQFVTNIKKKPETTALSFKSVVIHHSLIKAAKEAGLTTKIVHQLEKIFGGSINFSRDIRAGDRFSILYQEYYVDGKKIRNGNIMAAEFTNQGKTYKALRYTYPMNHSGYYTPNGHGVEPLFLRKPLHYKRISSRFSYRRMDPVVHKLRPHLGVDFAAPSGTPIKSVGDGRIIFIGRDDGYGNAIRIRYGRHYVALYAHMRRFAKNMRIHKYVRKGEVIGYVGETGWATGPHLHFGFYVNGIAKNWLAMKLPTGAPVPRHYKNQFETLSKRLLAELQLYQDTELAANNTKISTGKPGF